MTQGEGEDRLSRIETALEQVVANQLALQESIAQVDQRLESSVSGLVTMIGVLAEDATTERDAFQSEIRRIWEYLLQQSGNGNGRGES